MTQQTKRQALVVAVNLCRVLLAATFIFSGFVKANDPLGTVYKLEDYVSAMLWFTLPETFLLGCAVILALVEFTLGIYTLFGISRPKVSRLTVVFMVLMTLLTLYIAIANPVSDCGCFGDVLILSNGATLAKNIVLLAAALLVSRYYRLQGNLIGSSVKWFIAFVTLCSLIAYAAHCIVRLPVCDFSPYAVGTNLRQALSPQQPTFEVSIVYEKDGQTLELSAEDDDPDSTWTYIETRRTPVDHQNLATADFYITDIDGEDITGDILWTDGYTFLLVIPDLTAADEGCIDKVNEVYDFAQDHQMGFYCLTASASPEAQVYWSDHTGAEYGYSLADDRMLKTFVRAKPGLVLLHNGIIVQKWSNYNMPDEDDLTEMNLHSHNV